MKYFTYKLATLVCIALLCNAFSSHAQVPTYITPGGSSNNSFPFRTTTSNKVQWLYVPTDFTPTIPAGEITHVYFRTANQQSTSQTLVDLRISIGHENPSNTVFTSGTFKTGLTQVYGSTTTNITIPANGWWGVKLATPFIYNGTDNLIIEATVTGNCGLQTNQNSSNGAKRIWGGRNSTSGSFGSGQAACGLEIETCPAKITMHPGDARICATDNAVFDVQSTNTDIYQWQVSTNGGNTWNDLADGGFYSGTTTNTMTVTGVPAAMDGFQYRAVAINTAKACETESNPATLIIQPTTKSSIVIAPNPDSIVCKQTRVTLHSSFSNAGTSPQFQWMVNGQLIPGATMATFTSDTLKDSDIITCELVSSNICVFPEMSNSISFEVNNNVTPEVDINVTYNGDGSYTFSAMAINGGSAPKFQWYKNYNPIFGETSNSFTTNNVHPSDKILVAMASSEDCVEPTYELVYSNAMTTTVAGVTNLVSELTLHPNPNTGSFNITGSLGQSAAKDIEVSISNAIGQVVYKQQHTVSGTKLNIPVDLGADIANGVYTVNIMVEGIVSNIRFVLNR